MKKLLFFLLAFLWVSLSEAQIVGVGTLLTANNNASSSSWAPTTSAALEVGNLGVCAIAIDNISTTDGNTNSVSSITDAAGNTWTKAREYTNGQGGAAAGATVAVYYTRATTQLNNAAAITFNFASAITAKAAKCYEFTLSNNVVVDGTGDEAKDAADPGSLTATGANNVEHLWIRAIAAETTGTAWTATAGWTKVNATASAGAMSIAWEFKISTGTSSGASDPTFENVDSASVIVGLQENTPTPTPTSTATPTNTPTPTSTATPTPIAANLPLLGVGS